MMTILIVDDRLENRYLLEALLKGNGHEVLWAENGADALALLKKEPVRLIISDILMPVMDGFQLCREVRADANLAHIPFIFYTATYTGVQDEIFAKTIGADRFIVKPCEPKLFMEAVNEELSRARNESADTSPADEEEVLKLYNERLVRKLEQKMLQLEKEVTARREAEEAIRQSQEKYKSILDNIEDGYYEVDLAGNMRFFNPSTTRILGYSADELLQMNNRAFMDAENARKVFETFHRVFTTNEPARALDWVLTRKDGARCHVDTSVSLIRDPQGNPTGFRGIVRDVTERKIAEAEKLRLREQLQQARKMESIGRLAGGVAHDFNNFLSIILGYGEIVLNDLDRSHPHREPLEQIYEAGVRARELTRQLLAFSRKQVLETRIVDVNQVIQGFEKLMTRLMGEDIRLNLDLYPESLPVRADTTQMEQVLMNLAANARDAMPAGGDITITTAACPEDTILDVPKEDPPIRGPLVCIRFSDTGQGMDPETRSNLFEPFFTTKGKDRGTGLGLATVYGIVRQHGGGIQVESQPGRGTVFTIYLPRSEYPAEPVSPPRQFRDALDGRETLLLVEDNEMVRGLTHNILKGHGYHVLCAESGESALELLKNRDAAIDLLITDVVMPGMSGQDLVRRISVRFPAMRVLYMSGYADDVISGQALLEERAFFIQKPFSVKGLAEKVRKILDGSLSG